MLFKALTVVTLFSAVFAAPEPAENVEKRQAIPADVGALVSLIPASVLTAFLANPSGAESSILAQVQAGSAPGWITSLPTGVQQSLAAAFGVTQTGAPATAAASATSRLSAAVSAASSRVANVTSSLSASARASVSPFVGGVSNSTAGNSTALTGAQSSILANSSNAASSIAASVSNAASSAAASGSAGASSAAGSARASSTSSGLAARETGAMALGVGAIVGVLGLAAAL